MEVFEFLNMILRETATQAAMGAAYEKWSDDFARTAVRNVWNDAKDVLRFQHQRTVTAKELSTLTVDQLDQLGFGKWDESGLRLIPLWAWNYVANGETLTCINGETEIKGTDEIDLDARFGCIAYGVIINH